MGIFMDMCAIQSTIPGPCAGRVYHSWSRNLGLNTEVKRNGLRAIRSGAVNEPYLISETKFKAIAV
jgi:hypothetical protein